MAGSSAFKARVRHAVLTALAQEADITAGFAAEADDYIVKPFSLCDLAMRVNAVLARAQAGAPPRTDLAQPSLPPPRAGGTAAAAPAGHPPA